MSLADAEVGSTERFQGQHLTTDVEAVQISSGDYNRVVMSGFLGESLNVLDDSGLQHLIENDPGDFRTMLEERKSAADLREVTTGHITENLTLLDNTDDLRIGKWQSNISTSRECSRCLW